MDEPRPEIPEPAPQPPEANGGPPPGVSPPRRLPPPLPGRRPPMPPMPPTPPVAPPASAEAPPAPGPAEAPAPRDGRPRLYLARGDDPEGAFSETADELVRLLEQTEGAEYEIVRFDEVLDHLPEYDMPPLAPEDVYLFADLDAYDLGNVAVGGGRIALTVEMHRGDGRVESFTARSGGGLGGTGLATMRRNQHQVAKAIARRLLGRKHLNVDADDWTREAFRFGLAALIPVLGIPLAFVGLGYGIAALVLKLKRGLPRGRLKVGLVLLLNLVAPFIFFGIIGLLTWLSR